MGYFSNGTEGGSYYEEYCERCVHEVDTNCPVWNAHLIHNYNECNNENSILHMLIPKTDLGNEQCRMFVQKTEGMSFGDRQQGAPEQP